MALNKIWKWDAEQIAKEIVIPTKLKVVKNKLKYKQTPFKINFGDDKTFVVNNHVDNISVVFEESTNKKYLLKTSSLDYTPNLKIPKIFYEKPYVVNAIINDERFVIMEIGKSPPEVTDVKKFLLRIIDLLEGMHNEGVVHGDVKLRNIISLEGEYYFIDLDSCIDYTVWGGKNVKPYGTRNCSGPDALNGIVTYREDFFAFISLVSKYDQKKVKPLFENWSKTPTWEAFRKIIKTD